MASDADTTVMELRKTLQRFIDARDWQRYHHPKEVALSLSVEASELLEIFQWTEKEPIGKIKTNPKLMERIREELADVTNYCLDMANQLDIDLTKAVEEKLEKNEKKYPAAVWKNKSVRYVKL